MFSRMYIGIALLLGVAIWVDPQLFAGPLDPGERAAFPFGQRGYLLSLLACGLPPVLWIDTILLLGWRSLRGLPMMLSTLHRSETSLILFGTVAVMSVLFLDPLAQSHEWQPVAMVTATIAFLRLQPAAALVLGRSDESSAETLKIVGLKLFPLRTVALLDHHRVGWFGLGTFSVLTDSLRTSSERDWQSVVERLSDRVALIVLDARSSSALVIDEARRIVDRADLRARTLFVVGPNGEAPALRALGARAQSACVHVARAPQIGDHELLTSMLRPAKLTAGERRARAERRLVRSVPIVIVLAILSRVALEWVGGDGARLLAWMFVIFSGISAATASTAALVQLADIGAYFLVSDEDWLDAREQEPIAASLQWKLACTIPAVLSAALWAAPGLWILRLLRPS